MEANRKCTMCVAPNAVSRCSRQLRRLEFRRALTHCMMFTASFGSALASNTIDEPQEDFHHPADLPAQVSWADNIVHKCSSCIEVAPVRLLDSLQLPMCRPFRCQEAEGCLGSFRLADRSKWIHSIADGKEKSQGGTCLFTLWAETPAGL